MGKPKHLWSGNWERDSAAHADELARRRGELERQGTAEPPVEEAPREQPPARATRKPRQRARVALLVGLAALIVAAAAVALLTSGGTGKPKIASRPQATTPAQTTSPLIPPPPTATVPAPQSIIPAPPPTTTTPPPTTTTQPTQVTPPPPGLTDDARWLGVEFAMLPRGGVTIETVTRGGAADAAGLEPGDSLSQIDGRAITSFEDVVKAFAPLHPGSQIEITVDRGSAIFSTSFPMPRRPPRGP